MVIKLACKSLRCQSIGDLIRGGGGYVHAGDSAEPSPHLRDLQDLIEIQIPAMEMSHPAHIPRKVSYNLTTFVKPVQESGIVSI